MGRVTSVSSRGQHGQQADNSIPPVENFTPFFFNLFILLSYLSLVLPSDTARILLCCLCSLSMQLYKQGYKQSIRT